MQSNEIPIINYHKIESSADIGLTARHPSRFRNDLEILSSSGYRTVTFEDMNTARPLPEKPVIITFDDGYESVCTEALPLMQEYGFRGVVFMPAAFTGRTNDWDVQLGGKVYRHLSSTQLQKLTQEGFEIGSHGMSHHLLVSMDDRRLAEELSGSRNSLESVTGREVVSVSYPFGRFNGRVLKAAVEAGYRFGVASVYFRKLNDEQRHMALRRYNIYRYDSERVFLLKISARFTSLTGLRDWSIQKGGLATAVCQRFGRKGRKDTQVEQEYAHVPD